MHDVIIDDTKTSMAVTADKNYRTVKKPKKRRSFSVYLIDWVEKAMIIACLLSIDFLVFAGAGSYNMFSSMTFFTPEVLYILIGIFVFSIALMYIVSFSSFFQNLLTAGAVGLFVIIMLNQFAAFDKNSMLSRLAATYISQDLGLLFNYVSHLVVAGVIGFIFFLFVTYASKKVIAYFVFLLMLCMGGVVLTQFMDSGEHAKFKVVKDDVIIPNAKPGKKFVYIALPTVGSYNYLNDVAAKVQKKSQEYDSLRETLDIMLGFYGKNNFTLYPHTYVNDLDPANNIAQALNNNNSKSLNEYLLSNISVSSFWKFNNLTTKYVYLKENKLFDTFKRAKYGINAYQSGGIEMCYVNNEMVVDRCVEKNGLPIDFDGMNLSQKEKIEVLMAQWLESWGLFDDFAYSYNILRPFIDVETFPMIGVSYKNIDVKNSLDMLDILEKDIAKDNGNKAYFVSLNIPSNTFIYDEFCNVKPIDKWQNKKDLAWVKKVSDKNKRQAYADQLRCVYGRLQRFIDYLNNSPSAQKTVVVIQGVSGINGMTSLAGKNFIEELKNQKYVDMAIRDPLRKNFRVRYDICSAPNVLKQYLYRKGKCPELKEFNLHIDVLNELRASLNTLNLDEKTVDNAIVKFDEWYQQWMKARNLTPYAKEEKVSAAEEGAVKSEQPETVPAEEKTQEETKGVEVQEVPAAAENEAQAQSVSEENAAENADEVPAAADVVVGKAKLMSNEIAEEPEAKVEKLNIPVEGKKTEVKETVTEVPAADINSSDKLNIVIDNVPLSPQAPASVSSPAPVPAAANDNIPLENSAAQ